MKIERKYVTLAAITGLLVALDQLTKLYIHTHFELGDSVSVIPGFFNITYVRNTGAAFGIFHDYPDIFRQIFFLSMPPIAMIIILFMMKSVENEDRAQVLALSMIFGGALGNYIDRLRFGYVIDFLDFHYKGIWSYPAFNVADSAIVTAVILLMLIMTVRDRRARREAQNTLVPKS